MARPADLLGDRRAPADVWSRLTAGRRAGPDSPLEDAAPRGSAGEDLPVLRLHGTTGYRAKRAFDLVASLGLLALLSPVLLAIALALAVSSRDGVFFVQERVGARPRRRADGAVVWQIVHFRCLKFRTMVRGSADAVHRSYVRAFVRGELPVETGAAVFKLASDPRVTRLGALLRRTSLDELPQLLNVVTGDMSLVGPRPVPVYEVSEYTDDWCLERFAARPGITGIWQVRGRGRVTFEEMIRMDVEYARRHSLWLDLRLLAQTAFAVASTRGAR